jgi:isopenicillin N synthase-like dioxygenase
VVEIPCTTGIPLCRGQTCAVIKPVPWSNEVSLVPTLDSVSDPTVDTASAQTFSSIPEISLANWLAPDADRAAFAERLSTICHEVGFFHLTDHGVEPEFIDSYFELLGAFFALPESVKATIDKRNSPHFRGWERVGAELTNNRPDYREQLDVSAENPPYGLDAEPPYLRLDGPNQWLDDAILPGFHAIVDEFFERMGAVANELMSALAVGLGFEINHFATLYGERPQSFVKLINYPPTPDGEAGVNPHHDAGFLTLLIQHRVGGLQAQNPDGEWIDVPLKPGAFVVNLGEMLQAMTANYFVATTHRVITSEARLSSAYFHGPDLRTSLDPLKLDDRFTQAVAASPRHAGAGFMSKRDELLAGNEVFASTSAPIYGQQLWNYYVRSYPDNVRAHYPDLAV